MKVLRNEILASVVSLVRDFCVGFRHCRPCRTDVAILEFRNVRFDFRFVENHFRFGMLWGHEEDSYELLSNDCLIYHI